LERYRGRFNVAGEARRVAGTIAVEPATRRIALQVDDLFDDSRPFDFFSYSAVHGELIDGTPVTLLDCAQVRAGSPSDSTDASAATFHCRFWVRGSYLHGKDTFSRLTFALTDLLGWIGQRAFNMHSDFSGPKPIFRATSLPPFTTSASTTRGEIRFHAVPEVRGSHRSAHFATNAAIEVLPNAPVTLGEVFSLYLRPFQDLLTIATGRPQEIQDLRLAPSRSVPIEQSPRDGHDWAEVRFERWADAEPAGESPFKEQMLFSLSDINGTLAESIDAWFTIDNEIREVRSLATAATYRGGMFADQKFLNAAHALETYHRRRIGGQERPKAAHESLVENILGAAPAEHRDWLREKLAFSNELSLLSRLTSLRARVCERVEATLKAADKWEQWTRDTRNFNTHFTHKPHARIAKGKQLVALTESLLMVLDDQILADLGVSDFARNTLIARTQRFRLVTEWFAECDWSAP
jgi:hypothetical protein